MNRTYSKIGDPDFHLYKDCKYSSHYTVLNHEHYETNNSPYNPNTLIFKEKKLNRKLEKTLKIDQTLKTKVSSEFKHNLIVFYTFFDIFLLVFLAFAVLLYSSNDISESVLKIHIGCLISLAFLSNTGLLLILKNREFLINSKIFFSILALLTYTYLLLSNQQVLENILETPSNKSGLPCILSLVCFTVFLRMVLFDSYFYFLLLSLFASTLYLALTVSISSSSIYSILSEFSILAIFFSLSVIDSQLVDIRTKQLFWRIIQEAELSKQTTKSVDYERKHTSISLFHRCNQIKSELKSVAASLMYRELKLKLKRAILDLEFVQQNLGNNEEKYFEIEKENEMDEEDKEFIVQNYLKRDEVKVQRRKAKCVTIIEFPGKGIEMSFNFYGVPEIEEALGNLGKNWNFDIWFVHQITGHSVFVMGKYLFQKYGIAEYLQVSQEVQDSFFHILETGYKQNPYHNACHAADVCQSLLYFILQSSLQQVLTTLETATCIISALGHDINHPGVTNRFIINNKQTLALLYNDNSVLENMHCSTIFSTLQSASSNVFIHVLSEDWFYMRKLMIFMVLETDMSRHFEILSKFKAKSANLDWDVSDDKLVILGMGLKCSDIGHSAKLTSLHIKWSQLVCEEFFIQGDLEKSLKQTVSMYCDRENTDIAKSQAGFIKNICLPLYEVWCGYLSSESVNSNCLRQLEQNHRYWEERLKTTKSNALKESAAELSSVKMSHSAVEISET